MTTQINKPTKSRLARVALTAVSCVAAATTLAPAAWASDDYDSARRAAEATRALQEEGKWPEARQRLEQALSSCSADAAGRPCRSLARYSIAYYAELQSRQSAADAPALLTLAANKYLEVLAESPRHEATLKNLMQVYRDLGTPEAAEQVLKQAVEADKDGPGRLQLLLGRYYRDAGRFDDALTQFGQAAQRNPADPAAPTAIVALYADSGPAARLPELLTRVDGWKETLPAVAVEGYRHILRRTPGSPAAEQALRPWVSLMARQAWLSPSSFADLPQDWEPIRTVAQYAANPESLPPRGWWTERPLRRSVLAELGPALARQPEALEKPDRALRRLNVALELCPPFEDYVFHAEMRVAYPARLELTRASLSLFSRHPELDTSGQKSRRLIEDLFGGKAGAYRSADLAAMQRFHVTLGRWYAERGQWTGEGSTNARFQLSRAITSADERQRRGEPYQPLQEEKELLAGGYLVLQQPERARTSYLDAAEAFLDTDQLERATAALTAATERVKPPPAGDAVNRASVIRRILVTREAIAARPPGPDFEQRAENRWIDSDITTPFMRRQQFKVLSDLSLGARSLQRPETLSQASARAFSAALRTQTLVGTADLVRFERVKQAATAQADVRAWATAVLPSRQVAAPGEVSWPLFMSVESPPLYVKVASDAVLAGRFAAAMRRNPVLASRDLRYQVSSGDITVFVPASEAAIADAVTRLPRVEGLGSLSTARIQ